MLCPQIAFFRNQFTDNLFALAMHCVFVALRIRHCDLIFKPKQIMLFDNKMEKFDATLFTCSGFRTFLTENQSRNNWRQVQAFKGKNRIQLETRTNIVHHCSATDYRKHQSIIELTVTYSYRVCLVSSFRTAHECAYRLVHV